MSSSGFSIGHDRWHDARSMQPRNLTCLVPAALVVLFSTPTRAGGAALTPSDVALAVYASTDGTSYTALDSASLAGFFGVHRCLCPDTLSVLVQLNSAGQIHLGNSTVGVSFLLGEACQASPGSCLSLGKVSFSAVQAAPAPTFSSSLIFQMVEGATSVDCTSLSAGTTKVWAFLTQDGQELPFALSLDVPVVTATVGAPTAISATAGDENILVSWSPPSDATLVAGYQVLCLPPPAVAQPAGYESCGIPKSGTATINPGEASEVCSSKLSASTTSVRIPGLVNGTIYTIAVVAIDPSGGISALSPLAEAKPQPPPDASWDGGQVGMPDGAGFDDTGTGKAGSSGCGCVLGGHRAMDWSGGSLVFVGLATVWFGLRRRGVSRRAPGTSSRRRSVSSRRAPERQPARTA
jgi:hypothetical protein